MKASVPAQHEHAELRCCHLQRRPPNAGSPCHHHTCLVLSTLPAASSSCMPLTTNHRPCLALPCRCLQTLPCATYYKRQGYPLKKIVEYAKNREFTDLMVGAGWAPGGWMLHWCMAGLAAYSSLLQTC